MNMDLSQWGGTESWLHGSIICVISLKYWINSDVIIGRIPDPGVLISLMIFIYSSSVALITNFPSTLFWIFFKMCFQNTGYVLYSLYWVTSLFVTNISLQNSSWGFMCNLFPLLYESYLVCRWRVQDLF